MAWANCKRAHEFHQSLHAQYGERVQFEPNTVSISDSATIPIVYPMRPGFPKVGKSSSVSGPSCEFPLRYAQKGKLEKTGLLGHVSFRATFTEVSCSIIHIYFSIYFNCNRALSRCFSVFLSVSHRQQSRHDEGLKSSTGEKWYLRAGELGRKPSRSSIFDETQQPYNHLHSDKNLEVGHLAAGLIVHGDMVAAVNDDG